MGLDVTNSKPFIVYNLPLKATYEIGLNEGSFADFPEGLKKYAVKIDENNYEFRLFFEADKDYDEAAIDYLADLTGISASQIKETLDMLFKAKRHPLMQSPESFLTPQNTTPYNRDIFK